MPEIIVAENSGYCWGVERAMKITHKAREEAQKPLYTLGALIHNPRVIEDLNQKGVGTVESFDSLEDSTIIVRTHGLPQAEIERARTQGLDVIDATCPHVSMAQKKVASLVEKGYLPVIVGERSHPEVIGVLSCAGEKAMVVEELEELDSPEFLKRFKNKRIGLVSQSTHTERNLALFAQKLVPLARELLIHNTICNVTESRQKEVYSLAREVDAMVVIGGKNSGNTRELAKTCSELQPNTHHIENEDELQIGWFTGASRIGITAGASTPQSHIDSVVQRLQVLLNAA